ncbi:MAG: CAP domain-containing protein [Rubrobacteraceae bacterium]
MLGLALAIMLANPAPSEAAEVESCNGGTISLNTKEAEIFRQHNQIRRERNLKPYCVDPNLQKAARAHTNDMLERGYFSHTTRGTGERPGARIERYGYDWRSYGENIAWGSGPLGEPPRIMRAWMNSSGHRANILDGGMTEIGIGAATGTYRGYDDATMYTVDFGRKR